MSWFRKSEAPTASTGTSAPQPAREMSIAKVAMTACALQRHFRRSSSSGSTKSVPRLRIVTA